MAPKKEEPETPAQITPWEEPATLELLLDRYILENKFSGRTAGTSLYLVHSKRRDGMVDQVVPDQQYKLFLVT